MYRFSTCLLGLICTIVFSTSLVTALPVDAVCAGRTHCTSGKGISELAQTVNETAYLPLSAEWETEQTDSAAELLPSQSASGADALPSACDMRTEHVITSVKNQGLDGMCWAFATLGAGESYLLKNSLVNDADRNALGEPDLSEEQVGYYLYTSDPQPLYPTSTDAIIQNYKGASGGNALHASFFLSTVGVQNEMQLPYESYIKEHSEYQRYLASYRMTGSEMIMSARTSSERDMIKERIQNKGGVYVAFHSNTLKYYDNGASYAYYQDEYAYINANHAVLLVGWDDDYAKEHFDPDCQPSIDGAWLAKNSWGDGRLDDGYFWISYAELSLGEFASFTFEPREDSGTIYYYDGAGYSTAYPFQSAANVYYAETDETLSKIGFYQCSRNGTASRYTIQVYRLAEDAADPTNGTLLQETTGTCGRFGYQEVPLDTAVPLQKGERFSVVLSLKIGTGYRETGYLTIEEAFQSSYEMLFSASAGQSYVYEKNDSGKLVWKDTTTLSGDYGDFYNVNIHAVMESKDLPLETAQMSAVLACAEAAGENTIAGEAAAMLEQAAQETVSQTELDGTAAKLLTELEAAGAVTYPDYADANRHLNYGDVNEDGAVNVEDAVLCLTAYAKQSALLPDTLRIWQKLSADVTGVLDGITVADAVAILNYYAQQSAFLPAEWEERRS